MSFIWRELFGFKSWQIQGESWLTGEESWREGDEDELKLADSYRAAASRSTLRQLNLVFRATCLAYDGRQQNPKSKGQRGTLRLRNPFKMRLCGGGKQVDRITILIGDSVSKLLLCASCLALAYLVYRSAFAGYVHFRRDLLLAALRPQVRDGANRTRECALRDDIYYENTNDQAKLIEYTRQLDEIGYPIISVEGISAIMLGLLSLVPVNFLLVSLFTVGLSKPQIDQLDFIYNPMRELATFRRQVLSLADKIARSTELYGRRYGFDHKSLLLNFEPKWWAKRDESGSGKREDDEEFLANERSLWLMSAGSGSYNLEMEKFKKVLLQAGEQVKPANLTSGWHRWMLAFVRFIVCQFIVLLIAISSLITALIGGLEVASRVDKRLALSECQRWHPQAIPIGAASYSLPELASVEDARAYSAYDGTLLNYLELGLLVELRNFMSLKVAAFALTQHILTTLSCIWPTFWFFVYVSGQLDKSVWLHQIGCQLSGCIRIAAKWPKSGNEERRRQKLTESLTVSYLNFELFRRAHERYLIISSNLLAHITVFSAIALLFAYVIGLNHNSKYNLILLKVVSATTLGLSIYMALGARVTRQVERVMMKICKLLAIDTKESAQLSLALQLWRRQVLSESECKRMFALTLFGIYLSYDKILTFNVYLLTLWFILLNR